MISSCRFCLAGVLAVLLAACQPAQTEDRPSAKPAGATANPPASPGAAPTTAGTTGEHTATRRYRIDISYPSLAANEAPLDAMLHRIAGRAKQDFIQSLPDPEHFPEFAGRQLQLLIDFEVAARTGDFVSVRETGMQDGGGAHPVPIDSAIVYDVQAHRTVTLDDLFADPGAARHALADYARAELTRKIMAQAPKPTEGSIESIREWKENAARMIDDGTQPTEQNFANFIMRAGTAPHYPGPGLTLIFPPYQVAPYVYGTQTVEVPARAFENYLKPLYRPAFGAPVAD